VRGPLIAAVDLSTLALNIAILPLDPTVNAMAELRCERLSHKEKGVERIRYARNALHRALKDPDDGHIVSLWIEEPPVVVGAQGHEGLVGIFAACVASCPNRIDECKTLMPQTWRSLVGLKPDRHERDGRKTGPGYKRAAIQRVRDQAWVEPDYPLSDHEADAILLALAGRGLHWKHHNPNPKENAA
jgi:hypothetical protein